MPANTVPPMNGEVASSTPWLGGIHVVHLLHDRMGAVATREALQKVMAFSMPTIVFP